MYDGINVASFVYYCFSLEVPILVDKNYMIVYDYFGTFIITYCWVITFKNL